MAGGRRQFEVIADAGLDHLTRDEGFEIAAELRQILGAGTCGVFLHVAVDVALRHGAVHVAGRRLPHQDRIVLLAEVLRVRVPKGALACVRAEAHSNMASGMVAMPGRTALITSTSGSALASSVGQ